jgi:hypothetical protein
MGGGGATEEVSETTERIVKRIDGLKAEDSGRFWHAKGEELPW